jgi:hypothetical protein
MAIFANRHRKNRQNFGKFENRTNLRSSSNFFPKFGLAFFFVASAVRLRRKFSPTKTCVSKPEKFSLLFGFCMRAPSFSFKRKRKFFGFGSPVSFPKEPDAESQRLRRNGGGFFYILFFYTFGRPCPKPNPCADGKKELPKIDV